MCLNSTPGWINSSGSGAQGLWTTKYRGERSTFLNYNCWIFYFQKWRCIWCTTFTHLWAFSVYPTIFEDLICLSADFPNQLRLTYYRHDLDISYIIPCPPTPFCCFWIFNHLTPWRPWLKLRSPPPNLKLSVVLIRVLLQNGFGTFISPMVIWLFLFIINASNIWRECTEFQL